MISAERFYGPGKLLENVSGTDTRIHPGVARWWTIEPATAGVEIRLPNAATDLVGHGVGWAVLIVSNVGTDDFDVLDADGNLVVTIADSETAKLALVSKEGVGEWFASVKTHVRVLG